MHWTRESPVNPRGQGVHEYAPLDEPVMHVVRISHGLDRHPSMKGVVVVVLVVVLVVVVVVEGVAAQPYIVQEQRGLFRLQEVMLLPYA